jgi:hypothetical protein
MPRLASGPKIRVNEPCDVWCMFRSRPEKLLRGRNAPELLAEAEELPASWIALSRVAIWLR